jgi:DNA-binding NtrC family response regulator
MTHPQMAPETRRNYAVPKQFAPKSVLLVDADENSRRILGWLLECDGHLVRACGSTAGALDLVERRSFDFVISDHSSSGIDGFRVLETVKQQNSDTPVLLMTSEHEMEPYIEAIHRGALDYMCKPIDYGEIQRLLSTHCVWMPSSATKMKV